MIIGVPGKEEANKKEKYEEQRRDEKEKEQFRFEQQTPVKIFIPGGIHPSEKVAHAQTIQGQSREADMREVLIIINGAITRDAASSVGEYDGVLQVLAGKRMTLRMAQDNSIGGIYDDPAAIHEHLGADMLGSEFRSELKEAASGDAGTEGEIQEGMGGGAANGEQLAVIQGGFGIADGKFVEVRGKGARSATAYPGEDGIDFFFLVGWAGNDGI